ncbi:MAG: MarR family transcriptional regulator [Acholeplasmataceae bacterium]|nr:MarR family transcriptional regulator [Acholeplasmataceae bacterium]
MSNAKTLINKLLVDVFNRIFNMEEEYLHRAGCRLSLNEVHFLEIIRNSEEPNMEKLAKKLRMTTGSTTFAISRLVQKKCLPRPNGSDDRRKIILEITAYGESVLKLHDQFHNEIVPGLLSEYQFDQDEDFVRALENVGQFFTKKYGYDE